METIIMLNRYLKNKKSLFTWYLKNKSYLFKIWEK